MCEMHGNDFQYSDETFAADLSDIIFYCDFSGIFDRNNGQKKYLDRQRKAKDMFRPEGIVLDFGLGAHRYLAFERSASMSRNAKLSFLREDFYEPIRLRMMMDMKIGLCQLSKLYAYNGLMLSSGVRIEGVDLDRKHRVIVIDNPSYIVPNVSMITVEDDASNTPVRKYTRKEGHEDIEVIAFDGEGLISKEFAKVIDKAFCGSHCHTSFQIRMPYVKGMLHQVDFKDFLESAGTKTITDIFSTIHHVQDVDIILTKSMFKGYGWLKDNGMSWEDYWNAFRKYNHALYITNVSKEKPEQFTELNYQFLNTVSINAEEFRPADLPSGWEHSPVQDKRHWLTKETETKYYNLCADEQYRKEYFLKNLKRRGVAYKSKEYLMARILKNNQLVINEPVYAKQLNAEADAVLKKYALGKLIVSGDNRFLSGDLIEFLTLLIDHKAQRNKKQNLFYAAAISNQFAKNSYYAPKPAYQHDKICTLLRNPHIARNEEIQLSNYTHVEQMRKHYLGHLSDIIIVDTHMLAAERLGGADYDGDIIKTISDSIINQCVKRNYAFDSLDNMNNIPLLKIPFASPLVCDATDWEARFETVRNTFSSRVGQISNAALDHSIVAYNENSDADVRKRYREQTETLAILTGLEIDSAKSGVKPDLSEYLSNRTVSRSLFLKYKKLIEDTEERRAWYEPTHKHKIEKFFADTNWGKVDSNVELLPYLARQLGKHTPKIKAKTVSDAQLFTFADKPDWKSELDPIILADVNILLKDYEAVLSRVRACRVPIKNKARKNDIERILFARGQEETYDSDELYALFQTLPPERVTTLHDAIRAEQWHLLFEEKREKFLYKYLPENIFSDYFDLLSDFRHGGYRILGDLICDIDDENTAEKRRNLTRNTDSDAFKEMMKGYTERVGSEYYRDAVSAVCRKLLKRIIKSSLAVQYVVALGKRDLIWDLLLDSVERNIKKGADTDAE